MISAADQAARQFNAVCVLTSPCRSRGKETFPLAMLNEYATRLSLKVCAAATACCVVGSSADAAAVYAGGRRQWWRCCLEVEGSSGVAAAVCEVSREAAVAEAVCRGLQGPERCGLDGNMWLAGR